MNKEILLEKINKILMEAGDDEIQHSMEDDLHLELINEFCPDWVKEEINKLNNADFHRWCA